MKCDRRVFLKTMSAGAAAFMLTAVRAKEAAAAAMSDQHFIFCYFSGGWDILLSLDPRDWSGEYKNLNLTWDDVDWVGSANLSTMQRDALKAREGLVKPGGSKLNFGPLFESIFSGSEDYSAMYKRGSILRGISMDTLTHEVGRRYFITGKLPAGTRAVGSSIPAVMVSQIEPGELPPLPNLAVRMESYTDNVPFYANPAIISSNADLLRLLRRDANAFSGPMAEKIQKYRYDASLDDPGYLDRKGLLGLIRASQADSESLLGSNLANVFSNENLQSAGVGFNRAINGELNAAIAFQALTNDIAHCASIQIASGLDTHFENWQDDQPANQLAGWNAVAKLVRSLELTKYKNTNDNWLDHTTIVCFSEFSRTSKINNRGGRDHNLTNAAYVVGAMAPQNRIIGGTDTDSMNPMRINPTSGATTTDGSGITLTPKIIYSSLLRNAGFNTDGFRNVEIDALANE